MLLNFNSSCRSKSLNILTFVVVWDSLARCIWKSNHHESFDIVWDSSIRWCWISIHHVAINLSNSYLLLSFVWGKTESDLPLQTPTVVLLEAYWQTKPLDSSHRAVPSQGSPTWRAHMGQHPHPSRTTGTSGGQEGEPGWQRQG